MLGTTTTLTTTTTAAAARNTATTLFSKPRRRSTTMMMMTMSRKRTTSSSSKIKTLNNAKKNTKDDTTHAEDKNAKRTTTTKTTMTLGVVALAACAAMHCDASFADPSRLMNTIQCYPSLGGGGLGGGYESVSEAISQTSMAGEDIPFWANMAKYARFSISIMVGFAYMFARPVAKLLKEPKTAALVVLAGYGGFEFIKFTITEMLAMNDPESLL